MKLYPVLLAGSLALFSTAVSHAQHVPAKLLEPHDDAVSPEVLTEHATNGIAVVEGLIGTDGKLTYGYVLGLSHPDLVKYAVDSAKAWRYSPATNDGKPVQGMLGVPVFYPGDMTVTDDQLTPLVQVSQYIYHGWLLKHGYRGLKEEMEARKQGLSGVTLIRQPQTNHIVADRDVTPKNMKDAADFIDQNVGKAEFPEKTLEVLQRVGVFVVILPVVKDNPQPGQ